MRLVLTILGRRWVSGAALAVSMVGCGTAGSGDTGGGATTTQGETPELPATDGVVGLCEEGGGAWDSSSPPGDTFDGGSGGAEDSGFGMDDDIALLTSLYDINRNQFELGQRVQVSSVVVISPMILSEGSDRDEFFVQDPQGGPFSGMRVRTTVGLDPAPAPGDLVSVVGRLRGQFEHHAIEIEAANGLIFEGTAPTPEPVVLSPAELIEADSALALSHEGMLVHIESVVVTNNDPCEGEIEVESAIRIDDRFLLEGLPVTVVGDSIAGISGPLIYVSDGENTGLEIAPRGASDVDIEVEP